MTCPQSPSQFSGNRSVVLGLGILGPGISASSGPSRDSSESLVITGFAGNRSRPWCSGVFGIFWNIRYPLGTQSAISPQKVRILSRSLGRSQAPLRHPRKGLQPRAIPGIEARHSPARSAAQKSHDSTRNRLNALECGPSSGPSVLRPLPASSFPPSFDVEKQDAAILFSVEIHGPDRIGPFPPTRIRAPNRSSYGQAS